MRRASAVRRVLPQLLLCLVLSAAASAVAAQAPPDLAPADWQQHLDGQLPLQLQFADEQGHVAPLASYFGKRPVALVLMYLSCARLCPLTMTLTQQAFKNAGLVPGRDFDLLAVSIDPWDRPASAARRKAQLTHSDAWWRGAHLLTAAPPPGSDPGARLAAAVGFGYIYDAHSGQYGHPAGWVLVNPSGRISRYFFGLQYGPATLRAAVRNAAGGGQAAWSEPLRLLCYCLVGLTGRYDALVLDGLRAACVALLLMGAWLTWRSRRPVQAP